jgi:precorrin-6B methylase 2
MSLNWIDVSSLSFNVLLLLERVQLSWFPGWVPESELAIALKSNPAVEWYLRNKCPELNDWLDKVVVSSGADCDPTADRVRQAEMTIMRTINDLLVYVVDPAAYDALPFHTWDSDELMSLAEFKDKTVIDVGAGTGRLAFAVTADAAQVFAVEPVASLRRYIRQRANEQRLSGVYPVDGLLTQIPLPRDFADITMVGHAFGSQPEEEYHELSRVTKPGGKVILCPGNIDEDNSVHDFLISRGFSWARFEVPHEGTRRKYWTTVGVAGTKI